MKICYKGMLRNLKNTLRAGSSGERFCIEQLQEHLEQLAERYYAGDEKVVDEFLELYSLDDFKPEKKADQS